MTMKKTRNLFIVKGNEELVLPILDELQFKGLSVFKEEQISAETVKEVFRNNKSIVCRDVSDENLKATAIFIVVTNSDSSYTHCIQTSAGDIAEQFEHIAEKQHCDIGDHKSNSSGLVEAPKRSDCPYCRYIDDGYCDSDINLHRTLYRSENFFVMPTIGEFIKGYLLIIPKQHVMSNAELPLEVRREFLSVLEDVCYMINLTYCTSNILIWENGSGNGGIGKAKNSIVHSHTHVAPSKLDADSIETLSGFPFERLSYENLHLYGKNSYLLVRGKNDNDWRINDNPNLYIPRQYVRQLLLYKDYSLLPDGIWDWRHYPFVDKIKETCTEIQTALLAHWDELPERIKNNTKDFLPRK